MWTRGRVSELIGDIVQVAYWSADKKTITKWMKISSSKLAIEGTYTESTSGLFFCMVIRNTLNN